MAWYSLLPSHLAAYETWIIRVFLFLAVFNITPWLLAILYDVVYYALRAIYHEIPVVGGRARGETRPRAPSLRDRDRRISFRDIISRGVGGREAPEAERRDEGADSVREELRRRKERGHAKTFSDQSVRSEDG